MNIHISWPEESRDQAPAGADLQICGVTQDGGLWHTLRHASGAWEPFGDVKGATGDPGAFVDIACAGLNGELHLAGATRAAEPTPGAEGGPFRHTVRRADGSWLQFGDLARFIGNQGPVRGVALGALAGDAQLCAVTTDGRLWHTLLRGGGAWSLFGDVKSAAGDPGRFVGATCADVEEHLHVCTLTDDGRLWHTVRWSNGLWEGFGDLCAVVGNPGQFVDVACAGVGGELHVCGVTADGGLWHTLRRADGSWFPLGDVKGVVGDPGPLQAVGLAAARSGDLHLCAVGNDGRLWHTLRYASGAWEQFGDVKGATGDPGAFRAVDLAVV